MIESNKKTGNRHENPKGRLNNAHKLAIYFGVLRTESELEAAWPTARFCSKRFLIGAYEKTA